MDYRNVARCSLILAILDYACYVMGYSGGAPIGQCVTMTPGHGGTSRTDALPYTLTVSSNTYSPGSEIAFTLSGSSASFKGYMLQVRKASDSSIVGAFQASSDGQAVCANARTHTESSDKNSQQFTWKAPVSSQGDLIVVATIVQTKPIYWVMQTLANITEASPTTAAATTAAATTAAATTAAATTAAATTAAATTAAGNTAAATTADATTADATTQKATDTTVQGQGSTTQASGGTTAAGGSRGQYGSKDTEDSSDLKPVDIIIIVVTCVVAGLLLIGVLVMCIHHRLKKTHENDERKYRVQQVDNFERVEGIDNPNVVSSKSGNTPVVNYNDWVHEVKTEL